MLSRKLGKMGIRSRIYTYPDYSSAYGKMIHGYLNGNAKLGREEHFLLFLMDIMKDRDSIKKDLKEGRVLIMDRYFYTAISYICPSGLDYGRAKRFVELMNFDAPSIVFYLRVSTALSAKRKRRQKGKLDKFESDDRYLKKAGGFYDRMFDEKYMCRSWISIDSTPSAEQVHVKILEILGRRL